MDGKIDRIHISENITLTINDLEDMTDRQEVGLKPCGLWYAESDSWEEWCCYEDFNIERLGRSYRFRIEVDEDRILKLTNVVEVENFAETYCTLPEELKKSSEVGKKFIPLPTVDKYLKGSFVDYPRLAREGYLGLEVIPYVWQLRLEPGFTWYYGWDVPSGCIWNPAAIKSIKRIGKAIIRKEDLSSFEEAAG